MYRSWPLSYPALLFHTIYSESRFQPLPLTVRMLMGLPRNRASTGDYAIQRQLAKTVITVESDVE